MDHTVHSVVTPRRPLRDRAFPLTRRAVQRLALTRTGIWLRWFWACWLRPQWMEMKPATYSRMVWSETALGWSLALLLSVTNETEECEWDGHIVHQRS
jgi:hypothetical protein